MKQIFSEIASRVIAHWKTSLIGLSESAVIPTAGVMTGDPKAMKLAIAVGIWRLIAGLLSRDPVR